MKIYHIQVTLNLLSYELNSCNEYDEHLTETVYFIHLKPSDVCNLNKFIHNRNDIVLFNTRSFSCREGCALHRLTASIVFRCMSTQINGMQVYHTLGYFYEQVHIQMLLLYNENKNNA